MYRRPLKFHTFITRMGGRECRPKKLRRGKTRQNAEKRRSDRSTIKRYGNENKKNDGKKGRKEQKR